MRLREIRTLRKMTQDELGSVIGVSNRVISAWERGETQLTVSDACHVADALGCTLDELAGREFPRPEYSDPRQAALNAHYECLNDQAKSDVVGMVKSIATDPARRILTNRKDAASCAIAGYRKKS